MATYEPQAPFTKRVAYFSMEFAIHQSFKTYSGGLGFLAGSHMRSAYDLKQNMIGIGVLWKYGYYDQVRKPDNGMTTLFQQKSYSFLQDPDILVPVYINRSKVYVKALYLPPDQFGTVPMYFLTTDIPENDYLARTITHKLYDSDTAARIAQSIVLGIGGAKVLEAIGWDTEVYHMNEAHALPLVFHLYYKNRSIEATRQKVVFTTHTPEKAGNEEHPFNLLTEMGFFGNLPAEEVRAITGTDGEIFSHTLAALRLAKVANGVSQLHGQVSREMWGEFSNICEIKAITNAQNARFWQDKHLRRALDNNDDAALLERKRILKNRLIEIVADQTGKWFDPDHIIIVWARRFAEYKRADLIKRDIIRFQRLMKNKDRKVQLIWAGKPYPGDMNAISTFNHLVETTADIPNATVLTGYELGLSRTLKLGSDIWLNTPRRPREASGTSGMTAAMNGALNLSINDGWVCEWLKNGENGFLLPVADSNQPIDMLDNEDGDNLMDMIENMVLPTYYNQPHAWMKMVKTSMSTITPYFDSDRMATEYYELYNY